MNTISSIHQHRQTTPLFERQNEQEKNTAREREIQNDTVQVQGNFHHVSQKDFDRIEKWTNEDANNALAKINGKDLSTVHGFLNPNRVQMLINRKIA